MRVLLQRVSWSNVKVEEEEVGAIGEGLLALVGISSEDTEEDMRVMIQKMVHLRIFEDQEGKMNRSVLDVGGSILLVSQFTLYGDCRKGRRPSFGKAMAPELAEPMFDAFVEHTRTYDVHVETGKFRAMMDVSLCNQGPVTLYLETRNGKFI